MRCSAPPYPPHISDDDRNGLVQAAKDWAIAHGLAIRPPPAVIAAEADPEAIAAIPAPVTLFPSPFPRTCFRQARQVQKVYNELYAAISSDEEFLAKIVQDVANGDDFIANLWKVHQRVKEEGYVQQLSLGLFRSDYMVHEEQATPDKTLQVKQVEFNTIASSFGGLSAQTSLLHQHLAATEYPLLDNAIQATDLDLPTNDSTALLAAGLKAAFEAYAPSMPVHPRCILFLVQGGERNVFDQRHLEYILTTLSPPVPVFRLEFADILKHTTVADGPDRALLYRLPRNASKIFEVAVVYLRSGYGPGDYIDESSWESRYQLERSAAIKCPTVLTQLAGTKKVQQVLATPTDDATVSPLDRFLPDRPDAVASLRSTFANIYPLDTSLAGLAARKLALDPQACQAYVLKPQREGGGNNIYRGAIPGFLGSVSEAHWGAYILMELITPPPVTNFILRNGRIEVGGVICELGIYGTCVWDNGTGRILHNEEAGYLLRTKGDKSEEGGVAAGYGCMDSCSLV